MKNMEAEEILFRPTVSRKRCRMLYREQVIADALELKPYSAKFGTASFCSHHRALR